MVTVPYILDSDVGKVNQRQKRNTRPFITLQFSTDLQAFAIRQIQRYISSQQSERDLQIFLQFLDLASNRGPFQDQSLDGPDVIVFFLDREYFGVIFLWSISKSL